MLNTLQAASRLSVRAAIAFFTAVVLLLIQSAFWSNRVSLWMQAIIFATALVSYFRPPYGLLALAVLVPLAQVGSRTLDSTMRGGEALALAFLAGVLVRTWTLRGFRSFPAFPSTRLEAAALIFGLIVAASCAEQIWFLQIQRDYPWPFVEGLMAYASREYITRAQGFGMIFDAMLLLEGMALIVITGRLVSSSPSFAQRLVIAIGAGAIGTAALTIASVGAELVSTGDIRTRFFEFVAQQRWTVHVSDINAAGSFFAMTMFMAAAMAWTQHNRFLWTAIAGATAAALVMTASRTALFASMIVGVGAVLTLLRTAKLTKVVPLAATLVAVIAAMWNYMGTRSFYGAPSYAWKIRRLFLEATGGMLKAEPLFGVGIGGFPLWSGYYGPPELLEIYKRDNAHNNFAQLAGELGLTGLVAFIVLLILAIQSPRQPMDGQVARRAALIGLAVFLLTCIGGHPLLIPEVSIPFWIAVGLVAAFTTSDVTRPDIRTKMVMAALVALVLSVPFRVLSKASEVNFSRVKYGLSARNIMTSRATVFVPANSVSVEIPVRSRGASDDDPVYVDVLVNKSPAETITLTHREWQRPDVQLPATSQRRFHEIELRIRRGASPDAIDNDRSSVEVGKWEIISKPNG